jgi:WD40 repeat protein
LAFDPEGNYLITANSAGALYRWNFTDNKIDRIGSPLSGRHTSTVNDVIFSPDGKLMATCSYDWSVHLWNYQNITNRQIQPIVIDDYDSWVLGIIFSKDGKELVACGADRTIRTWNVNPEGLYQQVLDKVDRDLTVEEWNRFVGKDIPYEKTVRKVVN